MVKTKAIENKSVCYKCCDEIDLYELKYLNDCIINKSPLPDVIAEKSILAYFGHYSFLSIFYFSEKIYDAIWQQLKEKFESENQPDKKTKL